MEPFRFKQFQVEHSQSSFKVGTDGVLLGAWADVEGAERLLDIGTGSGLIALILAQRSSGEISAVEQDQLSFDEAQKNFQYSPWSTRLTVFRADIRQWQRESEFDVIVCNPPFFTQATKSGNQRKDAARHNDSLPITDLFSVCDRFASAQGRINLILPPEETHEFDHIATANGWHLTRQTGLRPKTGKHIHRHLSEWSRKKKLIEKEELTIREGMDFSPAYRYLCQDLYLDF